MLKRILTLSSIVLMIAACHEKGQERCDSTVIIDYNTVVIRCKYIVTDYDAKNCKATAQSFLDKYPDLSCKAEEFSSTSIDNVSTTLTTEKFKDIVNTLTNAGY